MMRIAYKTEDECWVDNKGARKDVVLAPDETDYYYLVDDLGLIFRCFDDLQSWDKTLGEVYDFNGSKVTDIPALVHPNYVGVKDAYKSRVSWVQGYQEGSLKMVINCTVLEDFRTILNTQTMSFTDFAFGIR